MNKNYQSTIAIIILNYNGWEDTINCVNSCIHSLKSETYKYKIFVIDNKSTDDSDKKLRMLLPKKVQYFNTGKNYGYAGGNNYGLKKARAEGFEYFCLLNNMLSLPFDLDLKGLH